MREFPWHVESAAKEIGAAEGAAVFEQACVFGRGEAGHERSRYDAEGATDGGKAVADGKEANGARDLTKAWVSTEEFVSAEAAERNLEAEVTGEFADEVGIDAINGGLIHGFEEVFAVGDEVGALNVLKFMIEMQGTGDFLRERHLVQRSFVHFVEAEGEGMDVFGGKLGGQGCNGAGVAAGGEECGYRNIGTEVHGQRFEQHMMKAGEHLLAVGRGTGVVFRLEGSDGRGEWLDARLLTGADFKERAGRQGVDSTVEGVRFGNRAPEIKASMPGGIGGKIDAGNLFYRLNLRREGQERSGGIRRCGPVEGLNAERITGESELLVLLVPNGDGEHSTQTGKASRTLLSKERKDNFSIAGGLEGVSAGDELSAKLSVVVDFAVKDKDIAAIRGVHGLVGAGGWVENGEAGVREEEVVIGIAPQAGAVWAATGQRCQ